MKPYKTILIQGLKELKFEVSEIADSQDELPWWIEEKWKVAGVLGSSTRGLELFVTFLNHPEWESGPKVVDDVIIGTGEMESRLDDTSEIIRLCMAKGNFHDKLDDFWINLQTKIGELLT